MNTRTEITKLQKRLDGLIQRKYVQENEWCCLCGAECQVMHHFVQKSQSTILRFAPINLIPLCNGCHFRLHNVDPTLAVEIHKVKGSAWYNKIRSIRYKTINRDKAYYLKLKKLEEELS